jgi:hypothetical protein
VVEDHEVSAIGDSCRNREESLTRSVRMESDREFLRRCQAGRRRDRGRIASKLISLPVAGKLLGGGLKQTLVANVGQVNP